MPTNTPVFVNGAPNGVRDLYLRTRYGFAAPPFSPDIAATVVFHEFNAEHIHLHYGDEWDASLEAVLPRGFMLGTAVAEFTGRGAFPDKKVFWIYSGFRY